MYLAHHTVISKIRMYKKIMERASTKKCRSSLSTLTENIRLYPEKTEGERTYAVSANSEDLSNTFISKQTTVLTKYELLGKLLEG